MSRDRLETEMSRPRPHPWSSEYVAATAARLRVVRRVDETVEPVDKESEVLALPRRRHLGDWHDADNMTLQAQHRQRSTTTDDINQRQL